MPGHLEGKVAIVTGARRGIGCATAVALARAGADVASVARTTPQLAETPSQVRPVGRRAQQIEADIGEPGAPSLIAAKVLAELGAIGILVNNAATVEPAGPTATAGPEDWARAGPVNLTGPVRLTLAVLDTMIEQGYGRIVNVSSGIAAAPGAIPGLNAYAASKAALRASWPADQPAGVIADLVTGDTTGQVAGADNQPRSPDNQPGCPPPRPSGHQPRLVLADPAAHASAVRQGTAGRQRPYLRVLPDSAVK